jgi:hypothetical protein
MKNAKAAVLSLLLLAGPLFGVYQYYYTDTLTTIDNTKWIMNGSLTPTPNGLTAPDGPGSLISKLAVPDGTSDYEVKTAISIVQYGGHYIQYLRASSDASPYPSGSYYAVALDYPWIDPDHQAYVASLRVTKRVSGVITLLASVHVACTRSLTA